MWGYAPHTPTREFLPGPGAQEGLVLRNQRVSVWRERIRCGALPHTPPRALPLDPDTQWDLDLRNQQVSV